MEPTPGILNGAPATPEALDAARRAIQSLATAPGDTTLTDRLNELLDGATGSTAPLGWIALALAALALGLALRHYRRRAPR